jgi:WD40 repeat protein
MRSDELVSGAADAGPERSRAGRPRSRRWTPGRIAWLLGATIALPWLPIPGPTLEGPAVYRARGRAGVPIRHFAFSPDGRTVATLDDLGCARLRSAVDGGDLGRDLAVSGFAQAVAYSPDGRHLAIGRDGPNVVLCDPAGGGGRPLGIPVRRTSDVRFSPDGRMLAVSSHASHEVILWDIEAGRPRMTLRGHTAAVTALAFAPDGRSLASASAGEVILWDLSPGRPRHRWAGRSITIASLAYSPDGRQLAAADVYERSVRIRDIWTGGEVRRIDGGSLPIQSVAYSPDGRLLATVSGDGFATLWGAADGREVRRLDGRAQYLRRVAFSPDGRTLAATGDDDDIRLWDLEGLAEEATRR